MFTSFMNSLFNSTTIITKRKYLNPERFDEVIAMVDDQGYRIIDERTKSSEGMVREDVPIVWRNTEVAVGDVVYKMTPLIKDAVIPKSPQALENIEKAAKALGSMSSYVLEPKTNMVSTYGDEAEDVCETCHMSKSQMAEQTESRRKAAMLTDEMSLSRVHVGNGLLTIIYGLGFCSVDLEEAGAMVGLYHNLKLPTLTPDSVLIMALAYANIIRELTCKHTLDIGTNIDFDLREAILASLTQQLR